MVFCTIRTKRFRSPCHLLICATCVADLLHVCGQFPFCVHLFGNLTSSQAQCFYILSIPIVGFTTGGPLILSMGIDRLIAVKFPTKSILVTVGFVLLGWVTTTTANTLSYSITDDLFTIQLIQMYAGITVNFAAASNVFVFYAINSEYRSVIKSMFGIRIKGGMIFEPSSTQTVTKVVPRSVSQPNVVFEKTPAAARRMTVV
ncbi:hypothetical protein L5515_008126 [Caenorhabditis briggsae]|uniref:G-protein coupled receptors family 1 profile domain-containing protein n=1 Tax=Caenorhabditis briggsae TaxID=6238 RepID=A0AAE9F667_CAEBR|nr:hypothetical protein L5515_008126 [Caenorhabditis briggsae]